VTKSTGKLIQLIAHARMITKGKDCVHLKWLMRELNETNGNLVSRALKAIGFECATNAKRCRMFLRKEIRKNENRSGLGYA